MAKPHETQTGQGFVLTPEQKNAVSSLCSGKGNCILTGPSWSGKTTVLSIAAKRLEEKGKNVLLCAPTGLTADALGSSAATIHHALGLSKDLVQEGKLVSVPPQQLRGIDVLFIDAVNRCHPLLIDILWNAYQNAQTEGHPFRVIVAGDFFQIGPALTKEGNKVFQLLPEYSGSVPSSPDKAAHWDDFSFKKMFLMKTFQTTSPGFAKGLSLIRTGDRSGLPYIESQTSKRPIEDALWVYTRNTEVNAKNRECIDSLKTEIYKVAAIQFGAVSPEDMPAQQQVEAGAGMKVIFVANDPKKRFCTGTQGIIKSVSYDAAKQDYVIHVVIPGKKGRFRLDRYTWTNKDSSGNTIGSFSQFPICPGYATLLWRISGMKLGAANISPYCWGHGQLYSLLILVSDHSKIHIAGPIPITSLKVDRDARIWEELEFLELLDCEDMEKELKSQMCHVKPGTITDDKRKNGLRFSVYTHQLIVNGQSVPRSFIVLRDENSRVWAVTNFLKYLRTNARTLTSDIGHKAYFISQFLNFVFLDAGDICRLEEVTIEHVRNFLHAYGYGTYGNRTHVAGTFKDCVTYLVRFLQNLIQDDSLDMMLTMQDLFVQDVRMTKKGAELILRLRPNLALVFDPDSHFILRDMPEAALLTLLSVAQAEFPQILMNVALSLCGGLRPSETCSLSVSDLKLDWGEDGDLNGVEVDLTREKPLRDDGKKTGKIKKERTVKIHPTFLPLFQHLYEVYMPWYKSHCKDDAYQPLCLDSAGRAMSYQDYYREFKKLILAIIPHLKNDPTEALRFYERVLEEESVAPHILRHVFTQLLVSLGFNACQIMDLRGDTTTESAETYLARKSDLLNLFDNLLAEIVDGLRDRVPEKPKHQAGH